MNLLAAIGIGVLLQAQAATVKGAVSVKDASMPVVDAVAVWDPASGKLRIALMPFKLQADQVREIREDSTMMVESKTPDAKKWPDWCPAAEIKIVFKEKAIDKGPAGVESFHLWAYGLQKKNFTHNVSNDASDVQKGFSKLLFKPDGRGGGTLDAVFSRKGEADDLKWDIAVKCAVLAPLDKK